MDKKLTLSLNEAVIENAKLFAKKNKVSLSKLIENYLQSIASPRLQEVEITPLVASLVGVIEFSDDSFDFRNEYTNHLLEKYK